jgi:hypothetical protein
MKMWMARAAAVALSMGSLALAQPVFAQQPAKIYGRLEPAASAK